MQKLATNPQTLFLLLLLSSSALWSCAPSSTAAAPCRERYGITVLPTLIPREDPNMDVAREGLLYTFEEETCGFDMNQNTPLIEGETWVQGQIQNVTLDPQDAVLEAVAAGQNNMALAWTSGADIFVGISRGGTTLQVERVDRGNHPDLFFSNRARLHLVYEQDGQILYRSADGDGHPAQSAFEIIDFGSQPQVAVDPKNWSHIIYEQDEQVVHSIQFGGGEWWHNPIGVAAQDLELSASNDLMILSTLHDNQVALYEFSFTEIAYIYWRPLGSWTSENEILGTAQLGFKSPNLSDEYYEYDALAPYWMVASWVEKETIPITTTTATRLQPIWTLSIDPISSGEQAVSWTGNTAAYDAGLFQTVSVTATDTVSVTAHVGSQPAQGDAIAMRLGLDLDGGTDPTSPAVIWSDTVVNPTPFTQIQATATANGTLDATIFLHAVTTSPDSISFWDDVTLFSAGELLNGDFEAGVFTYSTVPNIPEAWTPFFKDDYATDTLPPTTADKYTVQAVWSSDRGQTWQGAHHVTENSELSIGTTGALAPKVFPVISVGTEPDSVTFFYIYEKGDPPPESGLLRFGRLFKTHCELGTNFCESSPGQPILSRMEARPTTGLSVVQDQQTPHQLIMSWSALQTDLTNNDIYTSIFTLGAQE